MIYFISTGKHLKIGFSDNPEARLRELQTGNPLRLSLRVTMPGCYKTETGLHELFAHLRCAGEWFKYTDELRWFLCAIRDHKEEINIKTLYMLSQKKRIIKKAKKLGKEHKLNKRIKAVSGL
jgi:hypothetical protein